MKNQNYFWRNFMLSAIVLMLFSSAYSQSRLFGIQAPNTNANYQFVEYNLTNGNVTPLLTFPASFGQIWALTYNPDDNVFYTYAHAEIANQSELLEIDACDLTISSLGLVTFTTAAGSFAAMKSEGLAYLAETDSTNGVLYGTVGNTAGTPNASNRLVQFAPNSGNCLQLGLIAPTSNIIHSELDAMVFTNDGSNAILEGMDATSYNPISNSNSYVIDFTTVNAGTAVFNTAYANGIDIKGMAYDVFSDLIYTAFQDNMLMTIEPSYGGIPGSTNIITPMATGANTVRGMSFGQITCCIVDSNSTQADSLIITNTTWSNQIVVPDNTIIIVDGAELDVTNVDVIFGQCSGIDFINGANLRANNSVFRPCGQNDTWRGLRFEGPDSLRNQINESTFKNAEIALLFEEDAIAEINANTFSNCNEGITLDRSLFTETVFGNNFVTNNAYPEYANCYESTSPNDVIHIHAIGSPEGAAESTMMITQNNFTMNNTLGTISATGIDMLNSQASITENTMTNMEDGIVIHDPRAETHIESNEIENNNLFSSVSGNLRQIFIDQSHGVYVSINYNELRNSILDAPFMSNGIFLDRSDNVSIQSNVMDGFHFGINSRVATIINISENVFTSITDAAIYLDESGQNGTNFITCNDITMVMGRGFGIFTNRVDRFTEITSNCIKDGEEAIHLIGNSNLPLIRNNYMYNYRVGVNNNGHSGNIGTSTLDPGMNTFWSNDNGAIDINSVPTINVANNFGVFNISGAFITQNNPTHSTASCGHQLVSGSSQGSLNTAYTCDNNEQFAQPKGKSSGNFTKPSVNSAIAFLEGADNKMNVIRQFIYLEGCDLDYLTDVMNGAELTEQDKNMILYAYHKFNNEFTAANAQLDLLVGSDFENLVEIERLVLKKAGNNQLTESDYAQIASILNSNELDVEQYNVAVALSKTGSNHGMYRTPYPEISSGVSGNFASITEDKTKLEVFPNPSTNEINVQILEGKMVLGQELVIYDMFGNVVQNNQLDFVSGRERVDISTLSSGTYFVVLISDNERSERTKFIKL